MTTAASSVRCLEFVELITDWMENALCDDLRVEVEEHLAICPDCAEYLRQLRTTCELLATLDPGSSEHPADQRVLDALRLVRNTSDG